MFSSEIVGENLSLPLRATGGWLAAPTVLWSVTASLPSLPLLSCGLLPVSLSPITSYKDNSPAGSGSILLQYDLIFLFVYLAASGVSCGTWTLSLWCSDFLLVARGLSCSLASGIECASPTLQGGDLITGPREKSLYDLVLTNYISNNPTSKSGHTLRS